MNTPEQNPSAEALTISPYERELFERDLRTFNGNAVALIAHTLRIWGSVNRGGSFGDICLLMAERLSASAPAATVVCDWCEGSCRVEDDGEIVPCDRCDGTGQISTAELSPAATGDAVLALVAKIESYPFESQGGDLRNCRDWIELKAALFADKASGE